METVNLRRTLGGLYRPKPGRFELVTVPDLPFLAVDGRIEPGSSPGASPGFERATAALYGLAYTLKFQLKKRADAPLDYPVMPLEGLWWVEDGRFDLARPDNWFYRLLIVLPEEVTDADVAAGLAALRAKRGDLPEFAGLRRERFAEGLCAQVMHVGPYATEPETLAGLPPFLADAGLVDRVGPAGGLHHEIYLGDPRKADPAKLRTILRHPVAPA
ncbi:MAG: GyrI-like domain-containing protein [Actinobacteria bacterium]|nr:GyrI-like domain-containing protein [Actinomycetota bacterium]